MKRTCSVISSIFPIFFYFSLLLSNSAYSQFKNEVFERITTKDGLSQSTVNYIIQDKKGFMWFATNNGLNKYDGYTFKVYRNIANDKNSLSQNEITYLYEDCEGNIWMISRTKEGLNKFNPTTEKFTRFKSIPGDSTSISSDAVTHVIQDKSGQIWVITQHVLHLAINKQEENKIKTTFRKYYSTDKQSVFTWIYEDSDGNLLLFGNYLFYFDKKIKKIVKTDVRLAYSTKDILEIHNVCTDKAGNLWISTLGQGVIKLNYDKKTKSYKKAETNKLDITPYKSNYLLIDEKEKTWIGTESKGLFQYNEKEDRLINFVKDNNDLTSLSDNTIYSLCIDRSGILWIGTFSQGLCKYDLYKKQFFNFKSAPYKNNLISGNVVHGLHSRRSGELWVGLDLDGGVNKFIFHKDKEPDIIRYNLNPGNNTILSNSATCLVQRRNGEVWVGTASNSLTIIHPEKPGAKQVPYIKTFPHSGWIFSIFEDSKKTMWAGSWGGGLARFDKDETCLYFKNDQKNPKSIIDDIIWSINEDNAGNIWIGGRRNGFSILPANERDKLNPEFINYQNKEENPQSLSNNLINVFFQDHNGTMWIGTAGGLNKVIIEGNHFSNLVAIKKLKFVSYHIKNGLPSEGIVGILEDSKGNLWLGTQNGLSKFVVSKDTFINYNENDDLLNTDIWTSSFFKDQDGKIYFGGPNGFYVFYPENIKSNPFLPKVVFTDIKIFNKPVKIGEKINGDVILTKSINEQSEIILSHKNNILTLEFAALHYTRPTMNKYAYIMESFENNWNYIGNKREATYMNLEPGNYIFRVKASNNDGIWNEKGTSIKIIILPPWWKTWRAKLFYSLLILLTLYFFRKYSIISVNFKKQLWLEHIEKQKSEELNQLKLQFFTNISHELRTPLTLIVGPLNKLIKDGLPKKELELIKNNVTRLRNLVEQILDFRRIENNQMQLNLQQSDMIDLIKKVIFNFSDFAEQKSISLVFKSNIKELHINIDEDKIEKILTNILSNAFKHTPSGGIVKIHVNFDRNNPGNTSFLIVKIEDTGKGIGKEYLDKIFDYFYTSDTNKDSMGGTGIGLHLTQKLVELHQGKISVKSELGKGSVFTISLPVMMGKATFEYGKIKIENSSPINRERPSVLNYDNNYMLDFIHEKTILIIDDNYEMCDYFDCILKDEFNVIKECDPLKGFDQIVKSNPDLIVSDVMMPGVNGFELCKKIKTDIRLSHIPVLLLTAKATTEDHIAGLETGADDYVYKPFDEDLLKSRIKNLLKQRDQLRKHFIGADGIVSSAVSANSLDKSFIDKIFSIIKKNYTNSDFNVDTIIKETGMSRSTFYQKFRTLSNQSINDLIINYRLKRGEELLLNKNLSVSQIAYDIGFSSPAYFCKIFKERYKVTPKKYPDHIN